jgi:hypothetical protein
MGDSPNSGQVLRELFQSGNFYINILISYTIDK